MPANEYRIEELRQAWAAPLPGKVRVVFDWALGRIRSVFLAEDGQAQERSLLEKVLEIVQWGELRIADRNVCTLDLIFGIERQRSFGR